MVMSKCDCYQFETKRRYLSNIDKITYTLATERLAPEYIDEEVGVCYGTKEKDVCNCGGDKSKCNFYERVRAEAAEEKENLSTTKNVLEEIEGLIGDYWGTDPIYYVGSQNTEEDGAAKLCCKILEVIRVSRGGIDGENS
jgi:hypothetical protein